MQSSLNFSWWITLKIKIKAMSLSSGLNAEKLYTYEYFGDILINENYFYVEHWIILDFPIYNPVLKKK